jgi:hypothetical protein
MPEYEHRIIAFIDILGFSNFIIESSNCQDKFIRIHNLLTELRNHIESSKDREEYKKFDFDTQVLQV